MMTLFDEPSRRPLPTEPELKDHGAAVLKAALGSIPIPGSVLAEELGLVLAPPLARRRDDWFADLARRLHDLEGRVDGFHYDDLTNNEQFAQIAKDLFDRGLLGGVGPGHPSMPDRDQLILGKDGVYTFHAAPSLLGNGLLSFISDPVKHD